MHRLEVLKDMLCKELEEYGERDNLDVGGLDVVDKLAHAIKNINKIIEAEDNGYSGRTMYGRYDDGRSYEGRSMRGRGKNAKRDAMGRYSGDVMGDFRRMIEDAPDEHTRMELERMMQRYE